MGLRILGFDRFGFSDDGEALILRLFDLELFKIEYVSRYDLGLFDNSKVKSLLYLRCLSVFGEVQVVLKQRK